MQMNEPDESFSSEEEKKILDAAQDVARTEFDFPPRIGCPDSTTLRCLARRDPSVPDTPDLVDHIGTCSPCFVEYSRYHDEFTRRPRHLYALACAAVVIVVLIAAAVLLRAPERSTSPTTKTAGSEPPSPPFADPAPILPVAMTVDLAALSPTRSDRAQQPKNVRLPPKSLRLTLRLPLSMEPGAYRVQLRDAQGAPFIDMPSVGKADRGVTSLDLHLNLGVLPPGRYTLMLRPPGLSWRTYPVVIE
jgi:hypothetical protein